MPFVIDAHRIEIRRLGPVACQDVGDICFYFYDKMILRWRQNPRWTIAHGIKRDFLVEPTEHDFWKPTEVLVAKFSLEDIKTACDLAYSVFFEFHVVPYEREKEALNGTI